MFRFDVNWALHDYSKPLFDAAREQCKAFCSLSTIHKETHGETLGKSASSTGSISTSIVVYCIRLLSATRGRGLLIRSVPRVHRLLNRSLSKLFSTPYHTANLVSSNFSFSVVNATFGLYRASYIVVLSLMTSLLYCSWP